MIKPNSEFSGRLSWQQPWSSRDNYGLYGSVAASVWGLHSEVIEEGLAGLLPKPCISPFLAE